MKLQQPKYKAAGAPKKPFKEHLIQFRVSVKRKHYNEAQNEISRVIAKYR